MSKHTKQNLTIVIAICLSFLITKSISFLFIASTPKINSFLITSLPARTLSYMATLVKRPPTPTPTPIPTIPVRPTLMTETTVQPTIPGYNPTVNPTTAYTSPTATRTPTSGYSRATPTVKPTKVPKNTPTKTQTYPTSTPVPTQPPQGSCPTSSGQSYSHIRVSPNDPEKLRGAVEQSPDVNINLRGYVAVDESTELQSRHGNNYGLDDKMPPQISSLYGGAFPQIIKTYRVYEWDFNNNRSLAPQTASPNFSVHMIGLSASKGQSLLGLRAGRSIDGTNVFMVLYATKNYILFTHSNGDNLFDGYLYYFLGLCVDSNLLAAYNSDAGGGRAQLPVIGTGQVFGYGGSEDVKVVIRDTMSFVDPRAKEDWWTYGQ